MNPEANASSFRSRAPKGVLAGGRFGAEARREPELGLNEPVDDGSPVSLDELLGDDSQGLTVGEDEHGDSTFSDIRLYRSSSGPGRYRTEARSVVFDSEEYPCPVAPDDARAGSHFDQYLSDEYGVNVSDDEYEVTVTADLDADRHDSTDITEQLHHQSQIDRLRDDVESGTLYDDYARHQSRGTSSHDR